MRRLLLLIGLFCFTLQAQVVKTSVRHIFQVAEDGFTPEYQAVYDAMTVPPGIDTANFQDAMVFSLDSAGFWDRLDYFHWYGQKNPQGAVLDWINPGGSFDATLTNSPTFTVYQGITGDGVSAYSDLNYSPNPDSINVSKDDMTFALYVRSNVSEPAHIFGAEDGSNDSRLVPYTGANTQIKINSGSQFTTFGPSTGQGLLMVTRRGNTDTEYYIDGSGGWTDASTSIELSSVEFSTLANATDASYSTEEVAVDFLIDGISDAEAAVINEIIELCADRHGFGVQ